MAGIPQDHCTEDEYAVARPVYLFPLPTTTQHCTAQCVLNSDMWSFLVNQQKVCVFHPNVQCASLRSIKHTERIFFHMKPMNILNFACVNDHVYCLCWCITATNHQRNSMKPTSGYESCHEQSRYPHVKTLLHSTTSGQTLHRVPLSAL